MTRFIYFQLYFDFVCSSVLYLLFLFFYYLDVGVRSETISLLLCEFVITDYVLLSFAIYPPFSPPPLPYLLPIPHLIPPISLLLPQDPSSNSATATGAPVPPPLACTVAPADKAGGASCVTARTPPSSAPPAGKVREERELSR